LRQASVSRGVASDSQHMNGNATDIPGVPVLKVRQVARSLGIGGELLSTLGLHPYR